MKRQLLRTLPLVGLALAALGTSASSAGAVATVPAGFTDEPVASVVRPTALAVTSDGRMLITTQPGSLRIHQHGELDPGAALDLSARLCSDSERGLLGVAVDPGFQSNRFIYLYYTARRGPGCPNNSPDSPVNRVSRFTLSDANLVDPASELVLVDNIPSPNGNHNGGDLQFGKDGHLYVAVGDGGCDYAGGGCGGANDAARDRHVLLGKVLRITADGGVPTTNPFRGPTTARCNVTGRSSPGTVCQETFAWGLRNPFRLAFDPNAAETRFYVNDVGQSSWEEIDLGRSGADYGWNVREGHCVAGSTTDCPPPPAGMTDPVYDYGRGSGCGSITGGAFVPAGEWPSAYDDAYLFADYVCGKIFAISPEAGGRFARTEFATGLGNSSAVHLGFAPFGTRSALYYTTYAGGGEVRRIRHTGAANRAPTAAMSASPTSGPVPLAAGFDGGASSDPDAGDALTYLWDFGDGSPPQETSGSSVIHSYATAGDYTATLRVRDDAGAVSAPATLSISAGNTAPLPVIESPPRDGRFAVGESVVLRGSGTDAEDGTLPGGSMSWTVIRRHGDHTHPFVGPVVGSKADVSGPSPEDLRSTTNSHLEIALTARDSRGLSTTVRRDLHPKLVDLDFSTDPGGLGLDINGERISAPRTFTSWDGFELVVSAPEQDPWVFDSWSDGGTATHTIKTPSTPTVYFARFVARPTCDGRPATIVGTGSDDTLTGTPGDDVIAGLGGDDRLGGGAGLDRICAGEGGDLLVGEDGGDILVGEAGSDWLSGGAGDDGALGGPGSDVVSGGPGNDLLRAEAGRDLVFGDSGYDWLSGGHDGDHLSGGADGDRLAGGYGDDQLLGDAGNDWLFGEEGVDWCDGSLGIDNAFGCESSAGIP